MAKFFHDLFCLGRNRVVLAASFRPNGSGAITVISGKGIVSVTRASEGVYRVTLTDLWNQADSIIPHLQGATGNAAAGYRAQLADHDMAAKTIDIRIQDYATPPVVHDVASNANNWIHLSAVLRLGSTDM